MKVSARLTYDKVRFEQDTDAHLVISLTAPEINTDQVRPKLALILCIDISGSMEGKKLEYAKQSAYKMIEHLKPDDILGVVAFGSNVDVVIKPTRIRTGKDAMRKAVAALEVKGMTNFSGGMIKSLELLKDLDIGANYIHRLVMLTDGAANVGPAKTPADILKLLQANMEHVTCSAFGYGTAENGEFDPSFLNDFAREGKGNFAHVENPDAALKAFGTELGGLVSTYATDLMIELKPLNGHSIEKVVTDIDVDEENTGEVYVKIPDLLAEETRHIVVAVKLKAQKGHGPRPVNVFDVRATYQTFDAQGKKDSHEEKTRAKVQFVKDGEPTAKKDLDTIVGLAQLVRAQLEAEEQAKKGNYAAAASVMTLQSAAFNSRGLGHLAAASSNLSARMGSADSYQHNNGYLSSFGRGATRGLGVASYAGGADADLASLGVQMSNSHTTATSNAFAGGVMVAPSPAAAPVPAPTVNPVDILGGGGFTMDPSSTILGGGPWGAMAAQQSILGGLAAIGVDWSAGAAAAPIFQNIQEQFTVVGGTLPTTTGSIAPVVPAPVPARETKKQDTIMKVSKKTLKQSRKSW